MKRIHSFLAIFCIILATPNVFAYDFESGGVYFNIISDSERYVEVTYYGDYWTYIESIYEGNIVIPSTVQYNGCEYSVKSIGQYAFYGCQSLTSITIPEGVTSLEHMCFAQCKGLLSISLPQSISCINYAVFWGCSSLTAISLPDKMERIESNAFGECVNLKTINLPEGIPAIYNSTFYNCRSLTSISIPESVGMIGSEAFFGCSDITSLLIPKNVYSIENSAFIGCYGLNSITVDPSNRMYDSRDNCNAIIETCTNSIIIGCPNTVIPQSVTEIDWYAFSGITDFGSIISNSPHIECSKDYNAVINITTKTLIAGHSNTIIPDGVTCIGRYAFGDCKDLVSIDIPDGVTCIGDDAFRGCINLSAIELPESLITIGNSAFCECEKLADIIFPNRLMSIGYDAFYRTKWYNNQSDGLIYAGKCAYCFRGEMSDNTHIEIKQGTIGIGSSAFSSCEGMTSITIPEGVLYIGNDAFSCCTSLKSITIPEGVTKICDYTFDHCTSLTDVSIPGSLTEISTSAFRDCSSLETIVIPGSVKVIGSYAFAGCINLSSAVILDGTTTIEERAFSDCVNLSIVDVPLSLYKVGEDVFYNTPWYDSQDNTLVYLGALAYKYKGEMPDDEHIIIRDGTKSIGQQAFLNCKGLRSITIPESVHEIGKWAFAGCVKLESISIPGSVSVIDDGVFYDCHNLTFVRMPHDLTSIGIWGFGDCFNLNSIELSNSITSIGESAFCGCASLESVTIPEKVDKIGFQTFLGCKKLKSLYVSKSVSKIDTTAFWDCDKLDSIFVDPANIYLDSRDNCNSIIETQSNILILGSSKSMIPGGITGIGKYAFLRRIGLKSITIPESVSKIDTKAFAGCENLKYIHCNSTDCPQVDSLAFCLDYFRFATEFGLSSRPIIAILMVPEQSIENYKNKQVWGLFTKIVSSDLPETMRIPISEDGCATFFSKGDYEFSDNLIACVVNDYSHDKLSYEVIADKIRGRVIPAGVPVLIKTADGASGEFTLSLSLETPFYEGVNYLNGTDKEITTHSSFDSFFYKLSYGPSGTDLSNVIGWYWGAPNGEAFVIDANKAWLSLPKSSSNTKANAYSINGQITSVAYPQNVVQTNTYAYDLKGTKAIDTLPDAIYIKDGKKIFTGNK